HGAQGRLAAARHRPLGDAPPPAMKQAADDLYPEPAPGAFAPLRRHGAAAVSRVRRLFPPEREAAPETTARGPSFALSGHAASFAELEATVSHPDVLAAIGRVPAAPLATLPSSAPAMLLGADRLAPRPRRRPISIVDVMPASLELDVLELRLAELYDLVD